MLFIYYFTPNFAWISEHIKDLDQIKVHQCSWSRFYLDENHLFLNQTIILRRDGSLGWSADRWIDGDKLFDRYEHAEANWWDSLVDVIEKWYPGFRQTTIEEVLDFPFARLTFEYEGYLFRIEVWPNTYMGSGGYYMVGMTNHPGVRDNMELRRISLGIPGRYFMIGDGLIPGTWVETDVLGDWIRWLTEQSEETEEPGDPDQPGIHRREDPGRFEPPEKDFWEE